MNSTKKTLLFFSGAMMLLLPIRARAGERNTFVAQGGWPYVEAEVLSSLNAYAGLGLHWGHFLADSHFEDRQWVIPLQAGAGCQWRLGEHFRLRSGLRFLFTVERGRQRSIEEYRNHYEIFALFELGLRLELEFGLVAGVQLTFFGMREAALLPPDVFKHTYAYAGYAWWF